MLKIKTKCIDTTSLALSPYKEEVIKWNQVANDLAHDMRRDLANKACDKHPDEPNTATIVVLTDGRLSLTKAFCCARFERQVMLEGRYVAPEPPPIRRSLHELRKLRHHQTTR